MKKYLADILTGARFILALALIYGCVLHSGSAEAAFIIFLTAELTDTFDGTCARKWPFPKGKEPKYRKYAAVYDMVSDVLLAAGQVLFLTFKVNFEIGMAFIAFYAACALADLIIYGRFFGHPDTATPKSLAVRNFPLAKKIVMVRRYMYALCLGIINAMILFATNWPDAVKYILFLFGCSIFVFVWFFLRQRRENISRDAVDIERKLAKKKS